MEIKVYKDIKGREKTLGGLTPAQIISVASIVIVIGIDIANSVVGVVPDIIIKPFEFLIVGFAGANAIMRPHGLKFNAWFKLWWKYTTTIQIRSYKQERIKAYTNNDFKKNKKIKESNF